MERPALKRMMADIEAGKIDVVVIYKIDRLTRSLADFSKMVEVFERYGVSFVSVTQQFNTTTSKCGCAPTASNVWCWSCAPSLSSNKRRRWHE